MRTRHVVAWAATAVAFLLAANSASAAPALRSGGVTLGAPAPAPARPDGADAPTGGVVPGAEGQGARALMGAAGAHFGAGRKRNGPSGSATENHENYQWETKHHAYGVVATQSIDPTIKVPAKGGDLVYAPTMIAGGMSCIELTTMYADGRTVLAAWNWCAKTPGFDKATTVTSSFMSTYTKTYHGHHYYGAKIYRTDRKSNAWTAHLFNQKTRKWDTFFSSKGTGKTPGSGWDMWETWNHVDPATGNAYYCPAIKGHRFETKNVEFWVDGGWKHVTKADMNISPSASPDSAKAFHCPGMKFSYRDYGWVVSR